MNKRNRSSPKLAYTELHTLELRVGTLIRARNKCSTVQASFGTEN